MANNSEFIEILSEGAIPNLNNGLKLLKEYKQHINDINTMLKSINSVPAPASNPSGAARNISQNNNEAKEANRLRNENIRLTQKLSDARKQEAIDNAKLRVQLSQLTAENKKQALAALGVMDAYQKLNAESNELYSTSRALAAQMFNLEQAGEQGSSAYAQLAAEYDNVSKRANLLNNGLKKIDSDLGRNNRNVGNYASGWNGLNNAINQLTREAPAFALSLNTGFLAISNNLPILIDELARLRRENLALAAEGKPTVSVLKQLASSLLSWQTLLSVGVTLLTLYGGKLIDWATSAKTAKREIDQLNAATERYNNTLVESTTTSERELTSLYRKIRVAQDVTKSDEERAAAAKSIIDQYSGYLGSLSEEQIMLGNSVKNNKAYNQSVVKLTKDLELRANAEAKLNASRESLKIAAELEQEAKARERVNDTADKYYNQYGSNSSAAKQAVDGLREQIKARKELLKDDQEFISKFGSLGVEETGSVDYIGLYTKAQITQLRQRSIDLRQEVEKQQKEVAEIFNDTSLLDYNKINDTEQKTDLQYQELVDFEASRYELIKTRQENENRINEMQMDDDRQSLADRFNARKEYHTGLIELSKIEYDEQERLLELNKNKEIEEVRNRMRSQEITVANGNAVIASINKKFYLDSSVAAENNSERIREITRSLYNSLKGLREETDLSIENNITSERELQASREYLGQLKQIVDGNEDYRNIIELVKNSKREEIELTQTRLQNEERYLESQLSAFNIEDRNSKEYLSIQDKLISKRKERSEVDKKATEELAAEMTKLQKATESYLNSFKGGAFSEFGLEALNVFFEIDENGKSTFENLLKGAKNAEETFAIVFTTIAEVAQQAFAFITQNQKAQFDAQYANAQRNYEIQKTFTANTEEARAELERQYEERRREIRRREAETNKQSAIYNATISTAQGVAAAYATGPQGIVLAGIIAALGAAQIALIASQQIPQYEKGTNFHPGGYAIVGDGGKNELVWQPSSGYSVTPATDTLVNLERGSKVMPDISHLTRFNNNGIDFNGGVTIDYDRLGASVGNNIPAITTVNFDDKGFSKWSGNAYKRMINFNNRAGGIGRRV